MPSELSRPEADRLATLESAIERGMSTFVEVGSALLEIRESRLYQATHDTFAEYVRERWGMGRSRAHQLIDAANVVKEMSTRVDKTLSDDQAFPLTEKQARPLAALKTPEARKEAWEKAKEVAPNGKPTASIVQKVVDKIAGKSKVNGHVQPDPPDVARLRDAGVIPVEAVVEIVEPEPIDDAIDAADQPDELGDDDWLASLPLSGRLAGLPLKTFRRDALLYRRLEAARKHYQHHFRRESKSLARAASGTSAGDYEGRTSYWLRLEHPNGWTICPAVKEGGCAGSGQVPMIGECPKCHGKGYGVRTR